MDRRGQDLLCWSLLRWPTQVGRAVTAYLFVSLGFSMGAAVGKVNRTPGSRAGGETRDRKRGTVPASQRDHQHCKLANKITHR